MAVNENIFKDRTRRFALAVIELTGSLPRVRAADVIGRQLLRCGTSVGANYRAACRARSRADMIAKLAVVEEEADECLYWLDLLVEARMASQEPLMALRTEANELLAMTVASIKTLRGRKQDGSIGRSKCKT